MTEKNIDQLLDDAETKKKQFYEKLIEIHEDEKLREFAKKHGSIKICQTAEIGDCLMEYNSLYYSDKGFVLEHTLMDQTADIDEGRTAEFYKKDSKLIVEIAYGAFEDITDEYEMMDLFPDLTIEQIEKTMKKV